MKIKIFRYFLLVVGVLSVGIASASVIDSIVFGEAFSYFNTFVVVGYGGVGAIMILISRQLKDL